MFAIIDAYRNGLLNRHQWIPNIIAGLVVGIVALPLSMAFAIASGANPEQGLYTAIIAGFFVGVFGGSRVQIAGPTGAFVVILANITAKYGIDGLQIATLLAGFMLMILGFVRLGSVIKFIPDPVIVGFTAGIGVVIFVGQCKDFFGLAISVPLDGHIVEKFYAIVTALPHLDLTSTGLGLLSLMVAIWTPKLYKRLPGPLAAMVIATLIQYIFQFPSVMTIGNTFGAIPTQLPHLHIPSFTFDEVLTLVGPAFTIALLGAIESLLSATAADNMIGTRHHSNSELIGQGIANIVAPLFGGFAATGAIARTATNVRNGGTSPIAAIVHSLFLISVIVVLAPLTSYIPLCALAAILFLIAYNMSNIPHFTHIIKRAPRTDVIVLLATFALTILVDLVVAVNVGVVLAMIFFIHQMIQSIGVAKQDEKALKQELEADGLSQLPADMLVYTIQGPFFFGAAEKIEQVLALSHNNTRKIAFRLENVPFMDMTGFTTFTGMVEQYHKRGITVFLCGANERIQNKLSELGILRWVNGERFFDSLADAIRAGQN